METPQTTRDTHAHSFMNMKIELIEGVINLKLKTQKLSVAKERNQLVFFRNQNYFVLYKDFEFRGLPNYLIRLTDIQTFTFNEKTSVFTVILFNKDTFVFMFKDRIVGETFEEIVTEKLKQIEMLYQLTYNEDIAFFKYFTATFFESFTKKSIQNIYVPNNDVSFFKQSKELLDMNLNIVKSFFGGKVPEFFKFLSELDPDMLAKHLWVGRARVLENSNGLPATQSSLDFNIPMVDSLILMMSSKPFLNCNLNPVDYPSFYDEILVDAQNLHWIKYNTVYLFNRPTNSQILPEALFPYTHILPL
jgi:hypothetical protein